MLAVPFSHPVRSPMSPALPRGTPHTQSAGKGTAGSGCRDSRVWGFAAGLAAQKPPLQGKGGKRGQGMCSSQLAAHSHRGVLPLPTPLPPLAADRDYFTSKKTQPSPKLPQNHSGRAGNYGKSPLDDSGKSPRAHWDPEPAGCRGEDPSRREGASSFAFPGCLPAGSRLRLGRGYFYPALSGSEELLPEHREPQGKLCRPG